MSLATFHAWWTVALVILFIGIVAWAYSGRRKSTFDAAARLPLEDDDKAPADASGEVKHG